MFPTVNNPAVLEFEGDATANIEVLAAPLRGVVMNADHPTVITREHVQQSGLEGPSRLTPIPTELGKDRFASPVVAGDGASPRRVSRGALVEELRERLHVGLVEGLVTTSYGLGVFFCFVHGQVLLGCDRPTSAS